MMKLTIVFILAVGIVQARGLLYAQHVTATFKNAAVKDVFSVVTKQTGYNFICDSELTKQLGQVNFVADKTPLRELVNNVFQKDNISIVFDEEEKTIIIKKSRTQSNPQAQSNLQEIKISGKVTDGQGVPLMGVTIRVRNASRSTVSNKDGNYTINVPNKQAILVYSYIGYGTVERQVKEDKTINIVLRQIDNRLEELVVVGYETVKRKDLTGSVSSVSAKDIQDIPVNSAAEALAGRLAGVEITGSEGSPDAEFRIVVRGGGSVTQDNSPLYIIDGVQVEDGLNSLSPQDIESIDVLKDAASTAIYGARGANGVVLITTKGGKEGATTVNYNSHVGFNRLANKLDVMDPYNFVLFQWERSRLSSLDSNMFAQRYTPNYDEIIGYQNVPSTDWQEQVLGRQALRHTHNLAFYGGTAATKFSGSYTYNKMQGVMINSDFGRHLFNFRFDHTVSPKLKIGLSMRYTNQDIFGNGTSSAETASFNRLRNIIKFRPVGSGQLAPDEEDDDYFNETNVGNGLGIINPVAQSNAQYRALNTIIQNYAANLNYNFSPTVSFKSTFGMNVNTMGVNVYNDVVTPNSISSAVKQETVTSTLNQSNVLTYNNARSKSTFAKSNKINFLLGQEIFISSREGMNNSYNRFPFGTTWENALNQLTLGEQVVGFPRLTNDRSTLLSFFGRLGYTYQNKYLATLTLRTDGSSKFHSDNQWAVFPSGALSWRLSQEKFMANLNNIFSDTKIRVSHGYSGNNRIGDYLFQTTFDPTSVYGLNNDPATVAYVSTSLANQAMKWETTMSSNVGLDFGLLKDRITVTLDAYRNEVRDVLFFAPVPITSGYTRQLRNTGSTLNKGIEVQLTADIIRRKTFSWNTSFNISFNRNTINSISSGVDSYLQGSAWGIPGQPSDFIVQVGAPVGSMYGYVTDGYYTVDDFDYNTETGVYTLSEGAIDPSLVIGIPQPGLIKFRDIDGDGRITAGDQTIIGDANPKFFGGINQQFAYKGFDLSVFLNFKYGNDILNANKLEFSNAYANGTNMLSVMNDRWKTIDHEGNLIQQLMPGNVVVGAPPEVLAAVNADASIWMPLRGNVSYYVHSWAIEDGSFLRVNNITLGYTFPRVLLQRLKINRIRAYATLNNLAVITNYSGYDPEVNTRRTTPVTPGVDYSAYPRSRAYIVGLNVSF